MANIERRIADLERVASRLPVAAVVHDTALGAWVDCLDDDELDAYLRAGRDPRGPGAFVASLSPEKQAIYQAYEHGAARVAECDMETLGRRLHLLDNLGAFADPNPNLVRSSLWRYVRAIQRVIQEEG